MTTHVSIKSSRRISALILWGLNIPFIIGIIVLFKPLYAFESGGQEITTFTFIIEVLVISLISILMPGLGVIVLLRSNARRYGWLMLVAGIISTLITFMQGYAVYALLIKPEAGLPLGLAAGWLQEWWPIVWVLWLLALPMFFPDGKLLSPRWQWVFRILLATWILLTTFFSFGIRPLSNAFETFDPKIDNPLGFFAVSAPLKSFINVVWIALAPTTFIAAIASLVARWRASEGETRQQIKWPLLGLTLLVASVALTFFHNDVMRAALGIDLGLVGVLSVIVRLTLLGLPVSLGIGVLKYRLYDIDIIINRSLVYGSLTLLLFAVFASGFALMRTILEGILGSDQVILAAVFPAVVVTALFNPARHALRRFVDRRFYGIQIEYEAPARYTQMTTDGNLTHIGVYTNLEPVGSGGMAEVYRGIHPSHNYPVAVKVLPHKLAQQEEFRRRFEREARVVSDLKHPNIVQMHDFGVEDGTSYMVMEYIEGTDLSQLIATRGRIPLDETGAILSQIAEALDYAHQQGLVHRDIKPSNVMVDGNGRAVLMDFGIARIQTAMTQLTGTGGMVGTLDYIAPEQIHGASDVDGRADVYALGVMAFQMLAGELPFKKANPGALVMAHLMEPPPDVRDSVPGLPEGVAEAIIRAMAKRPEERFSAAGEMVTAWS